MTPASAVSADTPAWPEDAIEVGRILDAWGVKGWVRIQPFAADPQTLFSSRRWFLKPPDSVGSKRPAFAGVVPSFLKVKQVKTHGDGVVMLADGVDSRDAAELLRGARIFVPRTSFPTTDPDEYYWVDLIGLTVVNLQSEILGTVVGLIDTGPHSVLRIAPEGADPKDEAAQRLVPFVGAYVTDVSLPDRRITVDWGLDY